MGGYRLWDAGRLAGRGGFLYEGWFQSNQRFAVRGCRLVGRYRLVRYNRFLDGHWPIDGHRFVGS